MNIRKTTVNDIDKVMDLLSEARKSMARLGIDQWQYGYPSRDLIIDDVKKQRSYVVVEDDGTVSATFAMLLDGEVTYNKIFAGSWLTNDKYVAFHRIAIALSKRGEGYSDKIIEFIVQAAKDNSFGSIRVDTHVGNLPMRRMLEKNSFKYCGIIHLIDGQPRVAYEKVVD